MDKIFIHGNNFISRRFPLALFHTRNTPDYVNKDRRFLRGFWQITYVTNGTGRLFFGNSSYPVHSHQLFLMHPNAEATYDIDSEYLEVDNILFYEELIADELKTLQDNAHFFAIFNSDFQQSNNASVYIQQSSPRIRRVIQEMKTEFEEQDENCHFVLKNKLLELLILLLRGGKNCRQTMSGQQIAGFIDQKIHHNFQQKIRLDSLAQETGVHKNYLCALYKKYYGKTIFQAINDCRLALVVQELQKNRRGISAIATEAGLENPSYFHRIFKKKFGCRPGDFVSGQTLPAHREQS